MDGYGSILDSYILVCTGVMLVLAYRIIVGSWPWQSQNWRSLGITERLRDLLLLYVVLLVFSGFIR